MYKYIKFSFLAFFIFFITYCHLVQEDAGNNDTEKEWTVLLYQGGDNNLDPLITSDFIEAFYSSYKKDKIHLLALLDQ